MNKDSPIAVYPETGAMRPRSSKQIPSWHCLNTCIHPFYKSIVFQAKAEYFCFSDDFRLKMFS